MANHLFIFGVGYVAEALAVEAIARGWTVSGTARSEAKLAQLKALGIHPHLFDRDHPLVDPGVALKDVTHILSSVPPDADGDAVLDHHGDDLGRIAVQLRWVGWLGTTGVYGDRRGLWVDEESECRPGAQKGRVRLALERAWHDLHRTTGAPVHRFRLSGIYGPGRSPIDRVRAGQARIVDKPNQVFGRIHRDDIVRTLFASMAKPNPSAIYNVTDDLACPTGDPIRYACALLGVEPPAPTPFEQAGMTPMGRSFFSESKRVNNARIKRELGVTLAYPTYREGLKALFDAG
ncbi:MAG: SDR family oxidoreductase [Alphaproteobacteria bacterium]|nr:SDR family oxidoreductase [Alphaproteobacteria bacterium]